MTFDQSEPVPRIVHQIWVQGSPESGTEAECLMENCRFVADRAGWEYRLWSASDDLFSRGEAFRLMRLVKSVSNQSDVMRLAILGAVGGLYIDADVDVYRIPEELKGAWITAYRNDPQSTDNCVLAAPPGHPFIRRCMAFLEANEKLVREHSFIGPVAAVNVMKANRAKGIVQVWPGKLWNRPNGFYGHHLMRHRAWNSWQISPWQGVKNA